MPRIILCRTCQTIDVIPLWEGRPEDEAHDPILEYVVHQHNQKHGEGNADAAMMTVEDKYWDDPRTRSDILKRMEGKFVGFEPSLYDIRDTFAEDALRCYSHHHRPTAGCIDYHEPNKLLDAKLWHSVEDDKVDKSDHKKYDNLLPKRPVWLCDWCPVQSWVDTRINTQAHLYDKVPGEVD